MSCHGKDMGQLLVDYEGVWPIGTPPIETSPHPLGSYAQHVSLIKSSSVDTPSVPVHIHHIIPFQEHVKIIPFQGTCITCP